VRRKRHQAERIKGCARQVSGGAILNYPRPLGSKALQRGVLRDGQGPGRGGADLLPEVSFAPGGVDGVAEIGGNRIVEGGGKTAAVPMIVARDEIRMHVHCCWCRSRP
jgi:hypothetical protein